MQAGNNFVPTGLSPYVPFYLGRDTINGEYTDVCTEKGFTVGLVPITLTGHKILGVLSNHFSTALVQQSKGKQSTLK